MNPTPLSERRGCEWDDFGNSITIVLVRAPAQEVADELAALVGGRVQEIDPFRPPEPHPDYAGVAFQPAGHEWTVTIPATRDPDAGRQLSARLQTRALALMHEDTAGWTEYRVYDRGENVETYTFGPDYSDEVAGLAEEMGEEVPVIMPTDNGKPWDHRVKHDASGSTSEFLFRSEIRKVDPSSLHDDERTLDEAFKAAGAWLPGWAHWPWPDEKRYPFAPRAEFAAAYRVRWA